MSRRRITQVALAYAAIAWLLLQVGELLFKALQLPDWALRLLLALLLLGFPLAVVLAWFFDLTPAGVRRTVDLPTPSAPGAAEGPPLMADAGASGNLLRRQPWWRWLAVIITLALALALGTLAWLHRQPAPPAAPQRVASIAVLPFTSLSNDREDAYFAEGLAVELQDALAGVEGLKVAARASALAKGNRDLDVKQLGRTLGVATVLDASVRRVGSRVRISARLSDTGNGFTLWSRSYDRETSDVFAVQSEIANEVATALLGVLPGNRKALARRLMPTRDVAAYDSYLRGLHQLEQPGSDARLDRAVNYFGQALAADTGFARAQAGICRAEIRRFEGVRDATAFDRAQAACDRATSMDPTLREVSLALGELYRARGESGKAIEHYSRALDDAALRADAYVGIARTHGAHDRHELALEYFERARVLRPGDASIYQDLGIHHYLNGDLPKAIESLRTATRLQSRNSKLWSNLGGMYLAAGNSTQAAAAFNHSLAIQPTYGALSNLGTIKYDTGAYGEAAELYREAARIDPSDFRIWGNIGDALAAAPATAGQAREPYLRAARMAERYVMVKSDDAQSLATLAWFRARLGEPDAARELVARAEALGTEQAEVALWTAQTLALLGDVDGAQSRIAAAREAGIPELRIQSSPLLQQLTAIKPEPRQSN